MRNGYAFVAFWMLLLGCSGGGSDASAGGAPPPPPPPPPPPAVWGSGLCLPSGFCWENPLPQGNSISGLWGASSTDVWAVGGKSDYLTHFDGTAWSAVALPLTVNLTDIHGSSASDVWAVGSNGAAMHWDGLAWASAPWGGAGAVASDLFVASNGDAYVSTEFAGIRRRPAGLASAWSATTGTPSGKLHSVWGVGTTSFWSSGDSRYWGVSSDGTGWTFSQLAGLTSVFDVWASAPGDVWRIHGADVERSTDGGATWLVPPGVDQPVAALWGSGPSDLWARGATKAFHHDGAGWTGYPHPLPDRALAHWGTAQDAWIGGSDGRLARFDGTSFVGASGGVRDVRLQGLSATGPADVWAYVRQDDGCSSCSGAIWRRNAVGWRVAYPVAGVGASTSNPLWARAPDDVWFAAATLYHWNGSNWSFNNRLTFADAIHGSSATDVWVYAYDNVAAVTSLWQWNGSSWTERPLGAFTHVHAIYAIAPDDVWVAGRNQPDPYTSAQNKVAHWNGAAWTEYTYGTPNPYVHAIWAAAPDDVWFVGTSGTIVRWNGSTLAPIASGTSYSLKAISGAAANDVWAVGDLGTVRHWDGLNWTDAAAGADRYLTDVAAVPGHVWIGGRDAILHKQ